MKKIKPGSIVEISGQYEIINSAGKKTGIERTCTKGERLPPPPKKGNTYTLVDKTKHKK